MRIHASSAGLRSDVRAHVRQDLVETADFGQRPGKDCFPSGFDLETACASCSTLLLSKESALTAAAFPLFSADFHKSKETQGMEANVDTGPLSAADSSTSCDATSVSTSHSNTSGGHNDERVPSPASDVAAQGNSTRVPEDEDEDNRDFGEESRPLRLPSAPVDHARLPSESFSNGNTTAVLPQLSVLHNVTSLSETPSERRGVTRRRSNQVHSSNRLLLRAEDTSLPSNGVVPHGGGAVHRSNGVVRNTARDDRELLSHEETARSSNSSSSSSHGESTGNTSDCLPGREAAADRPRSEAEEVSVVSTVDESHFLETDDGGFGGTAATPGTALEQNTAAQRGEALTSRRDVCEDLQRQGDQPLSQPEQQRSLQQQQQRVQQQEERQERQPPQQEQQEQLQPQHSAQHLQQGRRREHPLPEQQQQQPPPEAPLRQGHQEADQQREGESLTGGDRNREEDRAEGVAEVSGQRRGHSDAARGESVSSAGDAATRMPARTSRDEPEHQTESDEEEDDREEETAAKSEENSSSEEEDADEDDDPTKSSYGCQHYRRRCKVVAPCCGEAFWCRHCHNDLKCEQEKDFRKAHEIDRTAVVEVICAVCETRQAVSNECINCKVEFGKYYCEKCKFWDDKGIKKKVYHCDLCGLCRTGGAESFFHCTTCGSCYSTDIRGSHKCVEKAMHQPCPICCENMFTSIRQVHVLKCGHTLHADCLERLKSECSGMPRLRCPLCFKSLGEYSVFWRRLDEEVARTPLPEELRRRVACTCNDCAARTDVDYHVVGLKCGACGSYNTREVGP